MNKNIKIEIAVGIMLVIAVIIGSFIWLGGRQQISQIQPIIPTPVIQQPSSVQPLITQPVPTTPVADQPKVIQDSNNNKNSITDPDVEPLLGYLSGWKLIYIIPPHEDCAAHIYEGDTKIGGWYSLENMYEEKVWMLNIEYYYKNNKRVLVDDTQNAKKVSLVDISVDFQEKLKKASKKNPVEFNIKGFYGHCEGAIVSLKPASQEFSEEIKTGIWSH